MPFDPSFAFDRDVDAETLFHGVKIFAYAIAAKVYKL